MLVLEKVNLEVVYLCGLDLLASDEIHNAVHSSFVYDPDMSVVFEANSLCKLLHCIL